MSTIPFEDIDDPNRKPLPLPIVLIDPRGLPRFEPGTPELAKHKGGDLPGKWHDGTFVVHAKFARKGWTTYEDLCSDAEVLERHGLTLAESREYYTRYMRLLKHQIERNADVHSAVANEKEGGKGQGWDKFYHPELIRRRGLPPDVGHVTQVDELAEILGDPAPPKDELAELTKPRGKKRAG